MSISKLEKKSEKDLMKEIGEKRLALRGFRFGIAGSKTRNVREGRSLRRGIAEYLTELRKRGNK